MSHLNKILTLITKDKEDAHNNYTPQNHYMKITKSRENQSKGQYYPIK